MSDGAYGNRRLGVIEPTSSLNVSIREIPPEKTLPNDWKLKRLRIPTDPKDDQIASIRKAAIARTPRTKKIRKEPQHIRKLLPEYHELVDEGYRYADADSMYTQGGRLYVAIELEIPDPILEKLQIEAANEAEAEYRADCETKECKRRVDLAAVAKRLAVIRERQ